MRFPRAQKAMAGFGLLAMLLGTLLIVAPNAGAISEGDPVLNPGGDDNTTCKELGYPIEAYVTGKTAPAGGTATGSATTGGVTYTLEVDWTFHADETISFDVTDESDVLVSAVTVKQASASSGGGTNLYTYDPPVDSDSGLVDPRGDGQFSHMALCAEFPEDADDPTLTVSKNIASTDQTALAQEFAVKVVQGESTVRSGNLGDDDAFTAIDPASGQYVITETLPTTGWQAATINCGDATVTGTNPWTVTVASTDVSCVITNTPTPPEIVVIPDSFGVDLLKVNDANEDGTFGDFESADAAGDAVEFQISIVNTGTGALTVTSLSDSFGGTTVDLLAEPSLSCLRSGVAVLLSSALPAGSTTVCTFTLDDYAPAAGSALTNTVTVDTLEGGDASDDSTVTTPAVLPEEVLPSSITIVKAVEGPAPENGWIFNFTGDLGTFNLGHDDTSATHGSLAEGEYTITETAPDAAPLTGIDCGDANVVESLDTGSVTVDLAEGEDVTCTFTNTFPEAEVLPDVVVRPTVLPRTGSSTQNLAGVGLALIGFGAVLLAGSRRRRPVLG